MMLFSVTWAIKLLAAHLRKFLKECDSYACTLFQGKRFAHTMSLGKCYICAQSTDFLTDI